jgi:CysZ protein
MKAIARALVRALPLLADPRVLTLVAAPLLTAFALWIVAAFAFGVPLTIALGAVITRALAALGVTGDPGALATAGGAIAAFVLITVVAGALALAAIAVFAGPVFVRAVEARYFSALEKKRGGTAAGSATNAMFAIALWVPMALAALPFLLFPPVGVPLSLCASAWLNQRLFRYDALAEHASSEERGILFRTARRRLFGLGLALSPLSLVPFVNLMAPLYAGLAFTCLCLDELDTLRSRTREAVRGGAQ